MANALLNRLERNSQRIHHGHIEVTEGMVSGLFDLQCFQDGRKASAPLHVHIERVASAHGEQERVSQSFLPANLLPEQFSKLGRYGNLPDGTLGLWCLLLAAPYGLLDGDAVECNILNTKP